MNTVTGTNPVRHFVCDDFVEPRRDWTVPLADAPVWECRYNSDTEHGKRTTRSLSGWVSDVLCRMHDLDVLRACAQLFGSLAQPDTLLHGAGLQVSEPGSWLQVHSDYERHPLALTHRRAVSLIVFCHYEWKPQWGGRLLLCRPDGRAVTAVEPVPGRLVAFENTKAALHGVEQTSLDAPERLSVMTCLIAHATDADVRTRAMFLPNRRSPHCPAEVELGVVV